MPPLPVPLKAATSSVHTVSQSKQKSSNGKTNTLCLFPIERKFIINPPLFFLFCTAFYIITSEYIIQHFINKLLFHIINTLVESLALQVIKADHIKGEQTRHPYWKKGIPSPIRKAAIRLIAAIVTKYNALHLLSLFLYFLILPF